MRTALIALLLAPLAASAQDMPLFTILKDGEGWKKGEGKKPETRMGDYPINVGRTGSCQVLSPDGGTLFAGRSDSDAIWAHPLKDGMYGDPAPYAPLRVRQGYDNSREAREKLKSDPPKLAVTALAVDDAGRIYAGTTRDLQIFDPTGRLCGVVSLPATGNPEFLRWEGEKKDTLVLWIGDQKWTRKMNATGK